jgi:hypothetical protein
LARLDSVERLVEAWSDVASTRDPRAALTAAGHVIAPSIAARLKNATPGRRFTPQQRAALLNDLRRRHSPLAGRTVRFAVRRNPPVTARALPAGQFDADAYLHVKTPDGREFDSRRPGGMGLLVNLEADHIGTAASPIVITLPMPEQDTVFT